MRAFLKLAFDRTIQALAAVTLFSVFVFAPLVGAAAAIEWCVTELPGAATLERQEYWAVKCSSCYYTFMATLNFFRPLDRQLEPLNADFEKRIAAAAEADEANRKFAIYRAERVRRAAIANGSIIPAPTRVDGR